ncbi:MAG TPA: hypothetical protein VK601_08025 [Kofleriaceae bacterium]|nr:hypothetical protein [Kofleriaceae bacterium]
MHAGKLARGPKAQVTGPGPAGQVVLYRSENGRTKLDVLLEGETVWLSQRQLTELFGKAKGTISEHIKHIFEDGELDVRRGSLPRTRRELACVRVMTRP